MLDQSTTKGRIIAAALRLAAERPWRDVTILDIAEAAHVTLADVRRDFGGKGDILAAFARTIDEEVLAKPRARSASTAARDALFEVIMERFDALAPHRAALRSIMEGGSSELPLALGKAMLASQAWMLNAAGIATDGVRGPVKVMGLASIYTSVFQTWLDDDDPGLARTMAALDRKLRRGESTMQTFEDVMGGLDRVAGLFRSGLRRATGGRASSSAEAPPPPGPETAAPTPPPPTL